MNSCFLFGHSDAPESCFDEMCRAIEEKRAQGVRDFYVGHYGAFDRIAARALAEIKKEDQGMKLYLVIPYHPALRTAVLPAGFDDYYYPFEKAPPAKFAIVAANRKMIEKCDQLIVFVFHPGKARDFLEEALRRKDPARIINLAAQK